MFINALAPIFPQQSADKCKISFSDLSRNIGDLATDAEKLHSLVTETVALTRSFYFSTTDADGNNSPILPTSVGSEHYYSIHTGEDGERPHVRVVRVPKERLETLEPAQRGIQKKLTDLSSSMKEAEAAVMSLQEANACTDLGSTIHQLDTLGKSLLGIQKQFKETASDIDWIFGKKPQELDSTSCI